MTTAMISFTGNRVWDVDRNSMIIEMLVDGHPACCVISREALEARFGPGGGISAVQAFEANRAKIEAIAERLVKEGCFESSSEIVLSPADLKRILSKGVRSESPVHTP